MNKKISKKKRINVSVSNNKNENYEKQNEINGFIIMSSKKIEVKKTTDLKLKKFSDNIDRINAKKQNRKTLNKTKFFLNKTNQFFIYQENKEKCIKKIGIKKKDIKEEICIFDRNNIKLFILVVDFPKIKDAKECDYLDMFFENENNYNQTYKNLYYDKIYFSNKRYRKRDTYLNTFLEADIKSSTKVDFNFKIKILDLYYFLIGYV